MRISAIALGVLIGFSTVAPATNASDAGAAEQQRRSDLIVEIVEKWSGHVEESYGRSPARWEKDMVPLLGSIDMDALQRAANAGSFDQMNRLLLDARRSPQNGTPVAASPIPGRFSGGGVIAASPKSGDDSTQSLGDSTTDLVYVPIVPCRILDTRLVGGPFAAGESREFNVTSTTDYSPQGGDASDCNGAGSVGAFAAADLSISVVFPTGAGFLTAHPVGTTRPLAATLDYNANELGSNQTPVRLNELSATNEFVLYSHASTHVVADIVGYYIRPQATALQCTTTFITQTVAANDIFDIDIPDCPVSYAVTGAGCRTPGFNEASWAINGLFSNGPTAATYCSGQNVTAGTITVEGTAQCCRVPGR